MGLKDRAQFGAVELFCETVDLCERKPVVVSAVESGPCNLWRKFQRFKRYR